MCGPYALALTDLDARFPSLWVLLSGMFEVAHLRLHSSSGASRTLPLHRAERADAGE